MNTIKIKEWINHNIVGLVAGTKKLPTKCEFITDHEPVWDGQMYSCWKCGLEFKSTGHYLSSRKGRKRETMNKCKHSYIMDCGGRIVRLTADGLVEEKIAGRGTYCIKCGHRYENPELLETGTGGTDEYIPRSVDTMTEDEKKLYLESMGY